MKLDILVFGAHPDDVELGCGGTVIKEVQNGKKVGIIDLTRGELGTRGTIETRDVETKVATEIMGVTIRENMDFKDGFFKDDAIALPKLKPTDKQTIRPGQAVAATANISSNIIPLLFQYLKLLYLLLILTWELIIIGLEMDSFWHDNGYILARKWIHLKLNGINPIYFYQF